LRDQLSRSAAPLGKRVVFHGFKQWQELPAIYAQSDILCAPSRYDGWGLIVPEGLAAGLLVISTDHAGAALDLITPDTGWIAEAGSVESLKAALRAAAGSSGEDRLRRIRKGRDLSRRLDVSVGLRSIIEAVEQSITYFGKAKTSNASPDGHTLRSVGDAG
jgi:glycosyltransferase involved in cell wall biosynthesis